MSVLIDSMAPMEPVVSNITGCLRCRDLPIDSVSKRLCLCGLEVGSPLVSVMFEPEPEDRKARLAALQMKVRIAADRARWCEREVKFQRRFDAQEAERLEASGRRWRFAAATVQAEIRRLTRRPRSMKKAASKRKAVRRIVRRAARAPRTARRRAACRRVQVDAGGGDPPVGPAARPLAAAGWAP